MTAAAPPSPKGELRNAGIDNQVSTQTTAQGYPQSLCFFGSGCDDQYASSPGTTVAPVIPDLHTVQVYRDRASIQFFIDNAAMGVNIVTHDVCASPFASQLVNTVGCHMTSRHQNRVGAHRSWRIHHEIRVLGSLQGTRNGHVLTQHLPEIC